MRYYGLWLSLLLLLCHVITKKKGRAQNATTNLQMEEKGIWEKCPVIWGLIRLEEATTSLSPREKMKLKSHLSNYLTMIITNTWPNLSTDIQRDRLGYTNVFPRSFH